MIERVFLSPADNGPLDRPGLFREMEDLSREFPGLCVGIHEGGGGPEAAISIERWRAPETDIFVLDELVGAAADAGPFALWIEGFDDFRDIEPSAAPLSILTRYQRFAPRKNAVSKTALFTRTLEKHRGLHNLAKPLVKADYDHALDTWQWLLRLDSSTGAAAQLAALFHDIERLSSEADRRIEDRASDYQTFKNRHARAGAEAARDLLLGLGWDIEIADRAAELIVMHEQPGNDPELSLLNDADALSFFSLNSFGFVRYFDPSHTKRKVAYTLARMTAAARERLRSIRLPPEIERLMPEARPGRSR